MEETIEVPREYIDWAESEALGAYEASSYQKPLGKIMWLIAANRMAISAYHKFHISLKEKDAKIENLRQRLYHALLYGTVGDQWQSFNGIDYIKKMQDIKLYDGTVIEKCWPNAGFFVLCGPDSNNKMIPVKDVEFVRKNKDFHK